MMKALQIYGIFFSPAALAKPYTLVSYRPSSSNMAEENRSYLQADGSTNLFRGRLFVIGMYDEFEYFHYSEL